MSTLKNNTTLINDVQTQLNNLGSSLVQSQTVSNKVTTISSASTDSTYPSAKSVYTYVQNMYLSSDDLAELENLLN